MRQGDESALPAVGIGSRQVSDLPLPLTAAEADDWATLIAGELGLFFPVSRRGFLDGRLWSRVRALGLASPALYRAYLATHPDEWEALTDALVVSESRFFREETAFRALREAILPECVKRRDSGGGRRELAFWSAGCSTGEEAYTLAMIALETVPMPTIWELHILGSDLSARNIAHAREGIYDTRRLEGLPPKWRALRRRGCRRAAGADGRGGAAADDLPATQPLRRALADRLAGCDLLPERDLLLPARGAVARPQPPVRHPAPRWSAPDRGDRVPDRADPCRRDPGARR
ncbi:MAG: Chemotaxis protein methyltransferase CheR [uncultured Thermomicrobiales bacterium]|uniref:protein-glutamate O-methyltransferase n=1 Tax=uncultured Thermomicrobiales bacterium TaxID=1645740 RepID=A0A6J4V1W4_9BACT|nr:MAG: Chemotaxis protein methyltransferase CheR [uncultured Thermomicrobiales bacterium]